MYELHYTEKSAEAIVGEDTTAVTVSKLMRSGARANCVSWSYSTVEVALRRAERQTFAEK